MHCGLTRNALARMHALAPRSFPNNEYFAHMSNYNPRVALITGAAQSLGYSIALQLADDGLDIAVNDVASKRDRLGEVVKEIQGKGRKATAVPADVTSEEEVKGMIERTGNELGTLVVMIANAGIARLSLLIETSVEDLEAVLAVNVRGVFLCYKHAALQMIKEGHGGRIIGASSLAGKEEHRVSIRNVVLPIQICSTRNYAVRSGVEGEGDNGQCIPTWIHPYSHRLKFQRRPRAQAVNFGGGCPKQSEPDVR